MTRFRCHAVVVTGVGTGVMLTLSCDGVTLSFVQDGAAAAPSEPPIPVDFGNGKVMMIDPNKRLSVKHKVDAIERHMIMHVAICFFAPHLYKSC